MLNYKLKYKKEKIGTTLNNFEKWKMGRFRFPQFSIKGEKMKKKLILISMIVVQVLLIIYIASDRVHLHMDEYLSFEFSTSQNMYIYDKEDFYNTLHDSEYYSEYLEVNEGEQNQFSQVYENQVKDVHPPLYYLLLKVFCNFNVDNFSIWPGIALNIILYIISIFVLYLIGLKIFKNDKKMSLLLCFVAGFNIGVLQIAVYIRMYQLLILATLLLLYWHLCKKDKEKLEIKDCIQLILIVCMGFLTQYYFAVIAVGFYIVHFIRNIKKKKFKEIFIYTIALILAVLICTAVFPYWISHVLESGRGKEASANLTKRFSYVDIVFSRFISMFNDAGFNGFLIGIGAILVLFFICMVIKQRKKTIEIVKEALNENVGISYILFSGIFYFVLVSFMAPYIEIRYMSPIIIFAIMLGMYYLKILLENSYFNKNEAFIILTLIFLVGTLVGFLNINENIFSFRNDEYSMSKIQNESDKKLIFIINSEKFEIYNSFEALLEYKNSIMIKNTENLAEDIIKILNDNNIKEDECVIGISKSIYEEVKDKLLVENKFKNMELDFVFGYNAFMTLKEK